MQWQEDMIINSMLRQSSAAIAGTLGLPEAEVADYIKSHAAGLVTRDDILALKRKPKTEKPKQRPMKKKEKLITSARRIHSPVKRVEKIYANRKINTDALIPVKVDHKTYIYVKPGTDIEKTRQHYIDLMNNKLTNKIKGYGT